MRRLAIFYGVAVVCIIVLADTHRLGPLGAIYNFPNGDKLGHFVVYGLLALLVDLAAFETWPGISRTGLALRVDLVLAVLVGFEELSQRLFPERTASLRDLAASYLGIAAFTAIAFWIARRWSAGGTSKAPVQSDAANSKS